MKKNLGIYIILSFLLVGCSSTEQQNSEDFQQNVPNVQNIEDREVIAENLEAPWSIAKYEDTFYLNERSGSIVKIENGQMDRQKVELDEDLSATSEAGLLGFVLDPNFSELKLAYGYYTYEDGSEQFNRIVTLRLVDNVWKEEDLLLDKIPGNSWHDGGRLKIGPDGKLYATVGDAYEQSIAQDSTSLVGKIIRMNLDGSIPSDNPFPNSYTYSYGHRNPQGITWSDDGTFYASEHGNDANDEVNQIEAGQNYGWPIIEGNEEQQGMVTPLFTSGEEDESTWAPSGMDFYNNNLYVAALRGSAVLEFDLETGQHREVITGLGRIRDVLIEDNYLYFISNNRDGRGNPQENDDKLYRISLTDLNQ
ncbi:MULTISPECIES: PQQ-dependent sugar dehydrogenase [unclassified Robertmurraya]|uniref:PQQ-dependent sugar dehydrogenase n=1 Tax=unclassified Robertmurraya TaxID=2837524 RepID=UPI0037041F26